MVALWLRADARGSWSLVRVEVNPAGLHEGIERVFVAVVPACNVFLSAALRGVSGVFSRASDFARAPDWPRGGAFLGALVSM